MLALVQCVDGYPFVISAVACGFDGAARNIDIRAALVDDAGIADAHAAKSAYGDSRHAHLGAVALLRLQGVDINIFASYRSTVKGHIRVVVSMDDGVRNIHGCAEARSDAHLFLMNVTGVSRFHIHITGSCQFSPTTDRGVDALLPGIRRFIRIGRRRKAYAHILCIVEVSTLGIQILGTHPNEFCALNAKGTFGLRAVHVGKLLLNFSLGSVAHARAIPVFIFGIAELGIGDALVDGGNAHIDAYAEAACGSARQ